MPSEFSLSGNLFECGNLPQNDVTYDFYTCGSRAFDIALYVWVAVIFLVATVVSVFIFLKKRMSSSVPETNSSDSSSVQSDVASLTFAYDFDQRGVWKKFVTLMWHRKLYTDFISQLSLTVSNEELYRLRQFTENITSIKKYVSVLATAAVAVTLPILVVKFADSNETEEKYLTHTHTYAWFYSLAYISGNLPVYLLMCGWTCMVIVLIAVLYLIEAKYITDQLEFTEAPVSSTEASRPIDHKHRLSRASSMHAHIEAVPVLDSQGWKMAGPLLLNVCVVLLFNILYIRRLSDGTDATMLLAIQIIFAFFKVIYSTWVVPVICKPITDIKKSIWLRVRIYLFNSIWIPVAAVLRTSPACFEVLLLFPCASYIL
jgi:flagellar basal body-associated protein FliL